MMTLRTLFEKEIFVRVSEDQSTLICTSKWPFFSITRRFGFDKAGPVKFLAEQARFSARPNSIRDFASLVCFASQRNVV